MKNFVVYAFLLASGKTLEAEQLAYDPRGHKPVTTITRCNHLARDQERRMRHAIEISENGIFRDVKIRCEKRRH